MKRLLFLVFLVLLANTAFSQLEVKPDSFKESVGFVNINPDPNYQNDDNDLPFAVIKIRTENINNKQRHELSFGGNSGTFIMLEYKDGEVWVYLTAKYADYLKISHPDMSSTEFTFPYDLKPKCGYEMILVNRQYQTNDQFGFITIKSVPSEADVYIDKEKVGTTPYLAERISAGQHRVEVKKNGFLPFVEIADIKAGEHNKQFENVKLETGEYVEQQQEPITPTKIYYSPGTFTNAFSVSDEKKVYFSKGNLQYQASTNTWRFAANPWDIIGGENRKISKRYKGWIDLFGWGTGDKPTKKSIFGDYSSFVDWGVNVISNGDGKNWHSLTSDEWSYVTEKRNTLCGVRYAKAQVNGVKGLVLLPDNWDVALYSLNNCDKADADYSGNIISQNDWMTTFDAAGAVFLPAAGIRLTALEAKVIDQELIYSCGYYWSAATAAEVGGSQQAICFTFQNETLVVKEIICYIGMSVRLVCDAE